MTQDQLLHRMLAQMMRLEQKMASKEDITGMERRMMGQMQDEVQTMKKDQHTFQGQVEQCLKKFEESQNEKMQKKNKPMNRKKN